MTSEEEKYLQIILSYSNDVRKKLEKEEIMKYKEILKKKGVIIDITQVDEEELQKIKQELKVC